MPTKNNVSSIKKRGTNILETAHENNNLLVKNKAGRKPKPKSEKASKPITIKLTQGEYTNLVKKAGRIPLATYIKDHLIETDFFIK